MTAVVKDGEGCLRDGMFVERGIVMYDSSPKVGGDAGVVVSQRGREGVDGVES